VNAKAEAEGRCQEKGRSSVEADGRLEAVDRDGGVCVAGGGKWAGGYAFRRRRERGLGGGLGEDWTMLFRRCRDDRIL